MRLLTVAIPTYNGEITIASAIDSILTSFKYCNREDVELIICDNASIDNTSYIVNDIILYNNDYAINYYKNQVNLGADNNFDLCVKKASGKYVWIFSDSEKIVNDKAIFNIVEILKKKEYDFLMLNYNNAISLDNIPEYYTNGDDFFQCTQFKSNFITSCIVNKSKWIDLHLESYYGTYWIQTAYQVKALSPKQERNIGYIKDIYIDSMKSIVKWGKKGSFLPVGINLLKVYSEMKQLGYHQTTLIKSCDVVKGGYPKYICLARVRGLKIEKTQYAELKHLCEELNNPLDFIDRFFLICPIIFCYLFCLVYGAYKMLKRFIAGRVNYKFVI